MDARVSASRSRSAREVAEALAQRQQDPNRIRGGVFDAVMGAGAPATTARGISGLIDFVPGIGDAAGFEDAYQAGKAGDYGTAAMLGAAGLVGLAPGVGDVAAKGMRKGIRAFHGSPHDFDRFDISKIGTGEGAQTYGHGLYFAENEGVAKAYRDTLSLRKNVADERLEVFQEFMDNNNFDLETAINQLRDDAANMMIPRGMPFPPSSPQELVDLADLAEEFDWASAPKGRMYEVNINADPGDFLDWDRPLSEQPIGNRILSDRMVSRNYKVTGEDTGGEALTAISGAAQSGWIFNPDGSPISVSGGGPSRAAEWMKSRGVPGIRYLDAGSRGAGDGSRNYVVFDDSLIEIVRKYGLAGLMAMGGLGALYQPQEAEQY